MELADEALTLDACKLFADDVCGKMLATVFNKAPFVLVDRGLMPAEDDTDALADAV